MLLTKSTAGEWFGDFEKNTLYYQPLPGETPAGIQASCRRNCHFADTPSPSTLKHLLKGEGGAAE